MHLERNITYECLLSQLVSVLSHGWKIWFSGAQEFVLLKASSGERCAPHNFVHLVTL